jgi:hypothetical protein
MRAAEDLGRRAELQMAAYHLRHGPELVGVGVKGADDEDKECATDRRIDPVPVEAPQTKSEGSPKTWDGRAFLVGVLQGLLVCVVQDNPVLVATLIGAILFICWLICG